MTAPTFEKYPEHEKLAKIKDRSQAIGEFLDRLSEMGLCLCRYDGQRSVFYPAQMPIRDLLADYFGIDQDRLEDEKRAMLEYLRQQQTK